MREQDAANFYLRLRKAAQSRGVNNVFVFISATECDSLCAFLILKELLKQDSIDATFCAVSGYNDVINNYKKFVEQADQAITAVFLNCGGNEDLKSVLDVQNSAQLFIVDSHRPVHLHNLSNLNKQVLIFFDDEPPSAEEGAKLFDLADDPNSADDFEEPGADDDDADGDDLDDDELRRPRKQKRVDYEGQRQRLEYYSKGSHYGKAAGSILYSIADSLNVRSNELLWLACVAVTDQLVHQRCTKENYVLETHVLEDRIKASNLDRPALATLADGTQVPEPENFRITCEEEPRLMLLSTWTLYHSLLCSTFTATKLQTWKEPGRRRLELLLAETGLPLKECKQKYSYMSTEVKRRFKEEIIPHAEKLGLSDLYVRSFQRLLGYKSKLSASDVVFAITAILENSAGAHETWADHFWTAVAALSRFGTDKLEAGYKLAMNLQEATFKEASLLIVRKQDINVKGVRPHKFYACELKGGADVDALSQPLAISRLLHFLQGAYQAMKKHEYPFVMAATSPNKEMALIVALCLKPRLGDPKGNHFSVLFSKAAENMNVRFRHDGFDTSWIWLDKAHAMTFMQRLENEAILRATDGGYDE